ncbi:hypothetical protein BARVI_12500 [Barnesiella viscericola DSM 18177]|uniref:ATP-binding protein n=1 Tax=Barnesiella viscericola DSM 18177 TaxID=880074 RepID=W0ET97_9BACT|nr:ATP-binding protein [Barnesiella viscericola]AHF13997.1 hypothetical protein BARVI_12500 [Barnesiella viscericola DSM 18177]
MDNTTNTYQPIVGKNLIEILMFSMYSDSLIIFREYVQNAFDAIVEAKRQGILSSIKEGQVSITIDPASREIHILDNGIGINVSQAQPILLNIADSHKDGIGLAGQYGIGRLVGAKYCKRLIFKTSAKGENRYTEITFDNDLAQKIISNKEDKSTATQVIDRITSVAVGEEVPDKHYFEVRMEEVSERHRNLLNVGKVSEYLKEVAPIDYMLEFKNMLYNRYLPIQYKSLNEELDHIRLTVNDEIDIRKRYGLTIDGTGDEISSLQFFKFEDSEFGLLGWGWYAITPFTKAIPASDVNKGIRLRKRNIQIGSKDLLNQYFREARGNNYFYGEIHAVHPNLRPNSSRDGLTHTPEAIKLYEYIQEYFSDLQKLYHLANDVKNLSRDIHLSGISTPQSDKDRKEIQKKISFSVEQFDKIKTKYKNDDNIGEASDKVLAIYGETIKKTLENLPTDILPSNVTSLTDSGDTVKGEATPIVMPTTAFIPEEATPSAVTDIFAPLNKKCTPEEVKLIRKVFAILSQNCPISQRTMFETMKEKAIKQLCK